MELEEAKKTMENFLKDTPRLPYDCVANHEIEAVETILNHLTKQEKMIELMVEKYNDDFGDIGDFCQHEYCSKDYNCKRMYKTIF